MAVEKIFSVRSFPFFLVGAGAGAGDAALGCLGAAAAGGEGAGADAGGAATGAGPSCCVSIAAKVVDVQVVQVVKANK